jgi:hypothetical protein
MNRRKFLAGIGSLAAASATAMGTGAFTSVDAERSVSVAVASDENAFLGLDTLDSSNSDEFVSLDGGTLGIDISETTAGGTGVNMNARTAFDDMFQITNQGTQQAAVYIVYDPDDGQPGFMPDVGSDRLDPNASDPTPELGLEFYEQDDDPIPINHPEGRNTINRSVILEPGDSQPMGVAIDTRGLDADPDEPLFDGSVTVTTLGIE